MRRAIGSDTHSTNCEGKWFLTPFLFSPSNETVTDYARYRMEEESCRLILALSVIGAGLLSLFLVLAYLRSIGASPETVVTGSGLVLVIFATVLIVILVKRDEQLTAATGILGTIAGYLFGKATKGPDGEQPEKS
jgi:hypothetical protein